jgi:nucleotide-binding universal stress UspA family protein
MNDKTTNPTARIVVGVDGSEGSKAALTWAMNQARLTEATVEAMTVIQPPNLYGYSYGLAPLPFDGDSIATIMAKALDDTIAEVSAQVEQPVTVTPRVIEGHPTQVLLQAAIGARMLVVGSRGHSTFAGILLGSVSHHCVQHAPCPVTVIPQSPDMPDMT